MDRLLFLNIAWMSRYEGMDHDTIKGGGKNVSRYGFGNEILNFKPHAGRVYGFAHTPHGAIRLQRLGAQAGDESIDGITVVWVAKSRIVGWYKNATVYRNQQKPSARLGRTYKGHPILYNVIARKSDCTRVDPPEARDLGPRVPRAKERPRAMGRYLWFAEGPENATFRRKVHEYIAAGCPSAVRRRPARRNSGQLSSPRQPDIYKRQLIERIAMDETANHFEWLKYKIKEVYRDNLGWDLEVEHLSSGRRLLLEVKGLSGNSVSVEMTPQEYVMMQKHKQKYLICVVTNCLSETSCMLSVFAYNDQARRWMDDKDRPLEIKEIVAARLHL